jgi:lincosamide nucleotidyltransferase A/C/D/E
MMSSQSAAHIMQLLSEADVVAWVDGGWGVDALLQRQTREHDDLDLVIGWEDMEAAATALRASGFVIVRNSEWPCSVVYGDEQDRRVDIHPVRFDDEGAGWQAQPNESEWRYPPEGFAGHGVIAGLSVKCLSPEVQILCHDGYELDEADKGDCRALAERFGLTLPDRFA